MHPLNKLSGSVDYMKYSLALHFIKQGFNFHNFFFSDFRIRKRLSNTFFKMCFQYIAFNMFYC